MVVLVLVAAIALRSALLWQSPYVPGMNGAYYLIQARSLLEKGQLGVPDLPLTFMLQAGVARLLEGLGLAPTTAVVTSVKLCDGLLPALLALPVWWLARLWCRAAERDERLALVPALLVTCSAPPLTMVGDFQKNALGLVWLAMLLVTLRERGEKSGAWRSLATLCCLALIGLTHIGVFGAALTYTAAVLVTEAVVKRDGRAWRRLLFALAAALVAAAVGTVVLQRFDPQRVHRLLTALTRPAAFLNEHGDNGGGPPGGVLWQLLDPVHWLASLAFAAVAIPAALAAWRRRDRLPSADVVLVVGMAAGTLLLTGPWLAGDKMGRFALIAFMPVVLLGSFALLHLASPQRLRLAAWVAGGIGLATALPVVAFWPGPRAGREAIVEMAQLKPLITDPANTLVVAAHGTEWWVAWTLHTQVAQPSVLKPELWQRHQQVLFLENRRGDGPGGPGGPGGQPPPPPPDRRGRPGPPPPGPPGNSSHMTLPKLPAGSPVLFRGQWLTLTRVDQPFEPADADAQSASVTPESAGKVGRSG